MLPKKNKLNASELRVVIDKGSVTRGKHFLIRSYRGKEVENTKFAVIVSKKVAGNVIKRNLIKRRVFSALKEVSSRLELGWFSVSVSESVKNLSYEDIEKALKGQIL